MRLFTASSKIIVQTKRRYRFYNPSFDTHIGRTTGYPYSIKIPRTGTKKGIIAVAYISSNARIDQHVDICKTPLYTNYRNYNGMSKREITDFFHDRQYLENPIRYRSQEKAV